MSSIGSHIAQRPYRAKNFTVISDTAFKYPVTSVEATAPTGATQIVGSVITFATIGNACSNNAGFLLASGEALSGTAVSPAVALGEQLLDLGRYVTVYLNSQKLYTLALVQQKKNTAGTTEGVGGATVGAEGYNAFYVAVETNIGAVDPDTGVGIVGVARV